MNDDLGPEDRTLGTALSRAVASQSVRETRFEDSRLGVNMNKPKRGSFLLPAFATIAAVLVGLFVGTALLNRGAAPSQVATSPTPTATAAGIASPAPTSGPTQAPQEQFVVWFARDQLPPMPGTVSASGPSGAQRTDRISARVRALWDARPSAAGSSNEFRTRPDTSLKNVTTTVSGDLATVVIDAGRWDGLSSAETIAVVQQLVYTITEEPGIRRAALREPGKDHAQIGSGMQKEPMTREDVNGYSATIEERIVAEDETVASDATAIVSNDTVAPGLGRVAIELRARQVNTGGNVGGPLAWSPSFTAELQRNDDTARPGKWILRVTLPGVTHTDATTQPSGTPIVEVRTPQQTSGVRYEIALSDARPWRVSVERGAAAGTMRVLVDIGGYPSAVANGTAVYSPRPGSTVSRSFTVSGAARAFEATVSWRVRDSAGREVAKGFTNASVGTSAVWGTFTTQVELPASVSGNVTLDVFQASPRDGSDTNKVEIGLEVR